MLQTRGFRKDCVIPIPVKLVGFQVYSPEFLIRYFDPFWVYRRIEFRTYLQAASGARVRNQVDHDLMAYERLTAPIHAVEREQTMLDLIPLAGSRRKVTDPNDQAHFIR